MGGAPTTGDPQAFFVGHPDGLAVFQAVHALLETIGPFEVRTSMSQMSFRRRRGFAYLWMPGRWLTKPGAEVVLSIVLGRHDDSPRFKEVVHPAPTHWMHHLEIHDPGDIDDEVARWLREAVEHAT